MTTQISTIHLAYGPVFPNTATSISSLPYQNTKKSLKHLKKKTNKFFCFERSVLVKILADLQFGCFHSYVKYIMTSLSKKKINKMNTWKTFYIV